MPRVTSKGKSDISKIQLAINLFDLENINPLLRPYLLNGRLDTETPVWVDKGRVDETALVFKCELLEAALVIDIVRNEQRKKGEPPLRAYIHRRTWSRLLGTQVLTTLDANNKPELDSDVFSLEEELAPAAPLPTEKMF